MRSEEAVSQTFTTCKVIDMVDLEVKKKEYNNRGYPNMEMQRRIEFWEKELDNPSIKDVLDRWTSDKLKYSEICQGTYDRYLRDFKRFFAYAIPGNLSLLTKDEK